MKVLKDRIVLFLCIVFLTNIVSAAFSPDALDVMIAESATGLSSMDGTPGIMMADPELFPAGNSINDWIAHALSLSGSSEYYSQYLDSLQIYVEEEYKTNGSLHDIKATEYHRIALTVMALGGDPTDFGVKPDGTHIDLIAEGTYNYIGKELGLQGLNSWIWALITLDASGAEIPADARYERQDMIDAIILAQEPDGGFGLDTGSSSVDITAMALQALSPYRGVYGKEIDNALNYLAFQMSDDCTYSGIDYGGSESISQVIMALCALGIDPETQSGFVKGEDTLVSALNSFRQPDGTYSHLIDDGDGNGLATCQALQALLSLRDYHHGTGYVFAQAYNVPNQNEDPITITKTSTDSTPPAGEEDNSSLPVTETADHGRMNIVAILAIPLVLIVIIPMIILIRRHRRNTAS